MSFEWVGLKAARNLQKHNVDFADAVTALDDLLTITMSEETSGTERFFAVGTDALGRLFVAVCAWHGNRIRIKSARKATPRERLQYKSKQ